MKRSLSIVDMTLPGKGLSVNYFGPTQEDIPNVSPGDVVKMAIKASLFTVLGEGAEAPQDELEVAQMLREWWRSLNRPQSSIYTPSFASPRETTAIANLLPGKFYDLVAQVVMVLKTTHPIVLLTDYTVNPSLGHRNEPIPPPFPAEIADRRILGCTIWDATPEMVASLVPGKYIQIFNMRCKIGSYGVLDAEVRKDTKFRKQMVVFVDESNPFVRAMSERIAALPTPPTTLEHGGLNRISIKAACSMHLIPNKFRCKARVVEYLPRDLRDFARPYCAACNASFVRSDPRPDEAPLCPECSTSDWIEYVFMFSLLLTDGTEYLPVIVSGDEARYFLGSDLAPADLYFDESRLQQLRLRLSCLWTMPDASDCGDAPRVQDAAAFECMIESYMSVQADGTRAPRYKLFNTQICGRLTPNSAPATAATTRTHASEYTTPTRPAR
nr:3-ketoacyl-CoA thiolase with broad chain length specificity [Polyrhizophydium stewartii]